MLRSEREFAHCDLDRADRYVGVSNQAVDAERMDRCIVEEPAFPEIDRKRNVTWCVWSPTRKTRPLYSRSRE